ncbi:VanZ family protein [Cohnella soli]|uniref:VanZ family protein n=1 Tax=Cohnella soli TaxID=425005 RepID=A0ABW0HX74_9BACL
MKLAIRICCWICLVVYVLILTKYLVLDRMHLMGYGYRSYNLLPFSSIKQYLYQKEHYNYHTWFMNLVGNFVMLMPLGLLLPLLHRYFRRTRNFIVFLIATNISIEVLQYYSGLGSADIDDVIMNSAGAIVVYLLVRILLKILNHGLNKENDES